MSDIEIKLEDIYDALGQEEAADFARIMAHVNDIIDNPNRYSGTTALRIAAILASHRTRVSMRAQLYKTGDKSITNRRRRDLLMAMYSSLEENINTLKLLGRMDHSDTRN